MPQLEERRPTMSPQLARRVAILGGAAFVLFAALFFRLWFLQVLSGESYVSQAAQNRVRKVRIEAPRGNIVDRNGHKLVKTREAAVVQLLPGELPAAERKLAATYGARESVAERARLGAADQLRELRRNKHRHLTRPEKRQRRRLKRASRQARTVPIPPLPADAKTSRLYTRLAHVIGVSPRTIHRRVIEQVAQTPYAAVTVKTDIGRAAFNYLLERQAQFPGVKPEIEYLRSYPYKTLGAHLFGTLREISPAELKEKRYRHIHEGERIGKDGVEETYDRYLRGTDGYYRQVVDALGQPCEDPVRCAVHRVKPVQGEQLQLTLDLKLEKAATAAVQSEIASHASSGSQGGAFVAMDPRNGEVLAMGSEPSFDANLFAKPISQETYNRLNSDAAGTPLVNRAIDGLYPTGSTFKLVTATAALQQGLLTPTTIKDDTGQFKLGATIFKNAGNAIYGALNIVTAIKVSSDVFFYELGAQMNGLPHQVLQTWARHYGFGHTTGIDLPGEFGGLVPDAHWRNTAFSKYTRCREKYHLAYLSQAALFKCGGVDKEWTQGDNVNLAVGQGDLQATPLQLATAYAALENGGTVVRPHLGLQVENGLGVTEQKLRFAAKRHLDISPTTRDSIMEGLHEAAKTPGGTSADVFKDVNLDVYGKTGTAERGNDPDQSWYVAFVPDKTRPIVVAVTIEKGGFGAEAAAPAACRILTTWYDQSPNRCHVGTNTSR